MNDYEVEVIIPHDHHPSVPTTLLNGVRVTHKATGKFAECTLYRHMYKNKSEAFRLLNRQLRGGV